MARPTLFTPEMGERVCALIAEGFSLRKIERLRNEAGEKTMPAARTILRWLATQDVDPKEGEEVKVRPFDAFRQQYARAREARADARFESIDDIVARMLAGKINDRQARVAIDALKWQAGKENAKRFGDSVTVKGDKDNPLQVRSTKDMSDEELAAIAAGGLRAA